MDPNSIVHIVQAVMIIPLLGIGAGITAGVIKMILQHQEKKAAINAGSGVAVNESLRDEFEALRQEVARLRDTSTQYDISIQHTLDELQYRVSALESKKNNGVSTIRPVKDEEEVPSTLTIRGESS